MMLNYDYRNKKSRQLFTKCVVDACVGITHSFSVLPLDQFLDEIRTRAPSDAAVARALGLPASRIAELFAGKRRLRYDEAKILADAFMSSDAPPAINEQQLATILAACLRNAPKGGWNADDAPRLARAVQHALELLASGPANQPSEDAIAMAGHAASLQLRAQHPEA